jgi:hypothetical protein
MERPESRDLTSISFNDFVSLVFNSAEQVKPDTPVSDFKIEIVDGTKLRGYYARLFQKPEFLLSRFTKQELEEGFWEIIGYTHDWSLGELIGCNCQRITALRFRWVVVVNSR